MKKTTKAAPKKAPVKTTKKTPAKAPAKPPTKTLSKTLKKIIPEVEVEVEVGVEVDSWVKESEVLKNKYPQLTDQQLHQYDGETIESVRSRVAEVIGVKLEDL